MGNKIASEGIKASATILTNALAAVWKSAIMRDAAGKASIDDTRRAFGYALRQHLRGTGEITSAARSSVTFDFANVAKAAYMAFCKLAKGSGKPAAALSELTYATVAELAVPFAEIEKSKRVIHAVLTDATGRFVCVRGESKFAGTRVELKGEPTKPEAFDTWDTMLAKANGKAAPVAAPAATPKGGKGK